MEMSAWGQGRDRTPESLMALNQSFFFFLFPSFILQTDGGGISSHTEHLSLYFHFSSYPWEDKVLPHPLILLEQSGSSEGVHLSDTQGLHLVNEDSRLSQACIPGSPQVNTSKFKLGGLGYVGHSSIS